MANQTGGPGSYSGTGNVFDGAGEGDYILGGSKLLGLAGKAGATVDNGTTADVTLGLGGLSVLSSVDITALSGGTANIDSLLGAVTTTTLDADGGSIAIGGGVTALGVVDATIEAGGSFEASNALLAAATADTVTFGAGGGTYTIADSGLSVGILSGVTIEGFGAGATIDDQNIDFSAVKSYSIATDGTVTFFSNANNTGTLGGFKLAAGTLTAGNFSFGGGPLSFASVGGALQITVCFLAGTNISTPDGEVAIETLKIGDPVLTADGRTVPVRWVGVNTVSSLFGDPLRIMPIRIRAGALADNVPARDLLVSPDHAMFVDGILIQANALVNGISITREAKMPLSFVYYHVELEDHALVLAEGAAAESFVDNIARMAFDNWAEHEALYGGAEAMPEMTYPRAKAARQVPKYLRDELMVRAEAIYGVKTARAA